MTTCNTATLHACIGGAMFFSLAIAAASSYATIRWMRHASEARDSEEEALLREEIVNQVWKEEARRRFDFRSRRRHFYLWAARLNA